MLATLESHNGLDCGRRAGQASNFLERPRRRRQLRVDHLRNPTVLIATPNELEPLRMETAALDRRSSSDELRGCNGPTDMTGRDPMLEQLDRLIGTWATEATHPLVDGVVPGSITFEWLEGGRFLIQRSVNDHELFPDAICVIGAPEAGDGLVMEYFDSRGVRRTYGVSFDDGVLRIWRDHPGFDQRFSAT